MTFTTQRRVEFRDTDAAGIVHFSAFFPMMESAEHEMLRSLGMSVMPGRESGLPAVTWPRVAAQCNYLAAARFEDLLQISVTVGKIGNTSVRYDFQFHRDASLVAEGSITVICSQLPTAGGEHRIQKVEIPAAIRELLSQHQQ